ncbi:WD40 repeat domain-containing protein [Synechococcus sp. PCC 7336]|uniref:WD40 repeat domain-containing protein n=1 Tax=Synechococcus sp. PCC 7336 TaxID=195250 RepID=UPI0003453D29|nr:hypothetical protein [Synechococcus sp. PCC 7336]
MKNKTHYSLLTVGRSIFALGAIALISCTLTSASSGNTSCEVRAQSIEPLLEETERLLEENQQFQALVSITKAGSILIGDRTECEELGDRVYDLTIKSASNLREYNQLNTDSHWILELSPNGNFLASYNDSSIQLWQTNGSLFSSLTRHDLLEDIADLEFSPDSHSIAIGSRNQILLYHLNELRIERFKSPADFFYNVLFAPDGQSIAGLSTQSNLPFGLPGGVVEIWQINDGYVSDQFMGGIVYNILHGHFTSSSFIVAVYSSYPDRTAIELIELDGTTLTTLSDIEPLTPNVTNIVLGVKEFRISPDSKFIATGNDGGLIQLWTFTGVPIAILERHIPSNPYRTRHQVLKLEFSPDSQLLAAITFDRHLIIWKVDGSRLAEISLLDEEIDVNKYGFSHAMEFSPDGQTIAIGDREGSIRLWNIDGTPILHLDGHQSSVSDLQFSPDGQTLASIDFNGNVIFWKPNTPLLIPTPDIIEVLSIASEDLLGLSCNWLKDYLASSPDLNEGDRQMCDWQNP